VTGTFIEAIYHTSVVVGGVEYFYGHGIYRKIPGSTHHGHPMEILSLGRTDLPSEVVDEYVESLELIYTPEAYDLFQNNCNNFSQDLSVFLVGKDIPSKIRELPQTFLGTPMGQMMRGMLDDSLRSMTQAPDAVSGQSAPPSGSRPGNLATNRNGIESGSSSARHPHTRLKLPGLQFKIREPVTYRKQPPLDKLTAKLGDAAKDKTIQQLVAYVRKRGANGLDEVPLPSLTDFNQTMIRIRSQLPLESQFALVDLVRIAAIDPRFSSWLVLPNERRLQSVIPSSADWFTSPPNLQVVTLQLACNLFNSNVFQDQIKNDPFIRETLGNLISNCLLASQVNVRALSAALVYDLVAFDHNERMENRADQVNVSAIEGVEEALVQAVINEVENKDTFHSLLLALGMMLLCAPGDDAVWELCEAMELKQTLLSKSTRQGFKEEPLLEEVIQLL